MKVHQKATTDTPAIALPDTHEADPAVQVPPQSQQASRQTGSGGQAGSPVGKGQGGLAGSYPNQGAKGGIQPHAARKRG